MLERWNISGQVVGVKLGENLRGVGVLPNREVKKCQRFGAVLLGGRGGAAQLAGPVKSTIPGRSQIAADASPPKSSVMMCTSSSPIWPMS